MSLRSILTFTAFVQLPLNAYGQDSHFDVLMQTSGISTTAHDGTGPFDPPTEDVFFVDSPSETAELDTGCTFDHDPIAPLDIAIEIDRAVGPVGAEGYLEDPDALVSAGVIPNAIIIEMPAYDVDSDGPAPPERDEVWLNGAHFLGYLNGVNNTWIPNTFEVDIRRIKFPAPPLAGESLTPAVNTIQIVIDTLSDSRWCTAIDWVSFYIPIRPQDLALTLEPDLGNRVRENGSQNTLDTIFGESFDADCNLTTNVSSYDEYPFFAPSSTTARLHATIGSCPNGSLVDPLVVVDWTIEKTGDSGSASWVGLEGDIPLNTPAAVGSYKVVLTFNIDGQAYRTVDRKLFVTANAPLEQVDPPARAWLEKATKWADELAPSDEAAILQAVLDGMYEYGDGNWRHGTSFGSKYKCSWEELIADPLVCDYSDSAGFSDVFDNISATLGLSNPTSVTNSGLYGLGFLTVAGSSIDPKFLGNAIPVGGAEYDRYFFSMHTLREKGGRYYDPTFGQTYASEAEIQSEFIAGNVTGIEFVPDTSDWYYTTDTGINIYPLPGHAYDSSDNWEYELPNPPTGFALEAITIQAIELGFPGTATYLQADPEADGFANSLVANVDVQVSVPGVYTVLGLLRKNGQVVANRPRFDSSHGTRAVVTAPAGDHVVSLEFSGEQILRSGEDGPYELLVLALGGSTPTGAVLETPALDHTDFGELPSIVSVTDSAIDETGDGRFDAIALEVEVQVLTPGEYLLPAELSKGGRTITRGTTKATLAAGLQIVRVLLPGQPIRREGTDGPFNGVVSLLDATQQNLGGTEFVTQEYEAADFATLFLPDGQFSDSGVDTNGNGLFEVLTVTFGTEITQAGTYLVGARLRDPARPLVVFTEDTYTLDAGSQDLTLTFSGPLLNRQEIDGPYQVEIVARDPSTLREVDSLVLTQTTAAYQYTDFESFEGPPPRIALTGESFDIGIDNNGNVQFDELYVDVGVRVTVADYYKWAAKIFGANGVDLGHAYGSGDLPAGTTSIDFVFDGAVIGESGVDGPYFVRSLIMYGVMGDNLVATKVATTQPYHAYEFEGGNYPPVADAGPDQIVRSTSPAGAEITLDGSQSFDPDGSPLTFTWTGSAGTFSGPLATLTLPRGTHEFTLLVEDGYGGVATDTVNITVLNSPPVADAGADQTVFSTSPAGAEITLDGSASSDIDGDTLSYTWSGANGTVSGSLVTLTLPRGTHELLLTVDDGYGGMATDTVTITVLNSPPVADAGPDQTVFSTSPAGAEITLNGSASSDIDGDTLSYTWSGANDTWSGSLVTPTLERGTHELLLTVDDGYGGSATDTVTITVLNSPPVADAGANQTVECTSFAGCEVILDGTASSDVDGDALSYTWIGPDGTVYAGATIEVTLPLGAHEFTLTVEDGHGGVSTDAVSVSVLDTTPPVVTAALEPVGCISHKHGRFEVQTSCGDVCDENPATVAELNGIPVVNGQRIHLKLGRRTVAKYRKGELWRLEAPSFLLTATCTDASGNASVATAEPEFPRHRKHRCERGHGHRHSHGKKDDSRSDHSPRATTAMKEAPSTRPSPRLR